MFSGFVEEIFLSLTTKYHYDIFIFSKVMNILRKKSKLQSNQDKLGLST